MITPYYFQLGTVMSAENLQWYVVQARTNAEKSVAKDLKSRVAQQELEHLFGEILVPAEEVVDLKDGQKRTSERKFFPGYVLVQIATDTSSGLPKIANEAWHLVKSTNKVTGFIGGTADRPLPITNAEADRILMRLKRSEEAPVFKSEFAKGQEIRITEGPFNDFHGVIEEVDTNKGTLRVSVLIFGRATPVDIGVNQVEALR